jgi:Copper transport outer membrane protein, MctB
MINFRFHIISLIAVFLALAIGVLFGSAFVKPTIVNSLNREINRVENKADAQRSENNALKTELSQQQAYIGDGAAYMVQDRLVGVDVVVVAERGVGDGALDATVQLLRSAGALNPAVVWLEAKWDLTDPDALTKLASVVPGSSDRPDVLRTSALQALADRLAAPRRASRARGRSTPDVLQGLVDAGFVSVDGIAKNALAQFPSRATRVMVVGGTASKITDSTVYSGLISAFVTAKVPTVAAEVFVANSAPNAPSRGDIVAAVRDDSTLSLSVSTVDDFDLTQGQVSAVLALDDEANGIVGHYGYGKGASHTVPLPQS